MRLLFLVALTVYLGLISVQELRRQAAMQPRALVAMANSLQEKPAPGVMSATKPHFPRLLGMKFVPLRLDWTLDSLRANGVDYLFLSTREFEERPLMQQYTGLETLPEYASAFAYWPSKESVIIELRRPEAADSVAR